MMGSSSCSPCLKLVLCRDKSSGFICFKDEIFGKSHLKSPLHSNHKNRVVDFKLSISRRGLRPGSQSSSHIQAEVDNHELLIEESPNGHTIEAKAPTVRVQFQLQRECSFGQNFLITGDDPVLGLWDPNNAIPLTWSEGHLWTVDLDIPIEKCIKFKFIMQESNGEFVWQPGPDRVLECFKTEKIITLCEDWENPDSRRVTETDRSLLNQEIQTVAAIEEMPVEQMVTQEPQGYVVNMKEVLVSDEGVPVLVPGLSQLAVNEIPNNEPEVMNGAEHAVVSTGPDMAMDLKLPELDSKEDIYNSNPRLEISSIHENQDPCEIKVQQRVAEEQYLYHEATQGKESNTNDMQWGNNIMQKLLNIFGIQ